MSYQVDFNRGIMNEGNQSAIEQVMVRGLKGEKLTVAFLGGSITQGSLATVQEKCYAYLTYQWWVKHFPKSDITFVNAGIGGTTSQFGVARADADLLSYQPDFAVVEFTVNDDNNEHFQETYEGLVRKILNAPKAPAVMLVHNCFYDQNRDEKTRNAEDMHLPVGKYYDLPCVSVKSSIYPLVADGTIPNREITPDDLHPNDAGHELLSQLIINLLDQIYGRVSAGKLSSVEKKAMPKPMTQNTYEDSIRYQNTNFKPVLNGFEADLEPQNDIRETFRKGFTAWKKGDKILFSITAKNIAVQFRKTIHRPTPIARVVIDGKKDEAVILDGNFDEDWGDCTYIETICEGLTEKEHTVEIEIIETHENDQVPFYLIAVIGAK